MPVVDYQHELPYLFPEGRDGESFPGLWVEIEQIGSTGDSIAAQAHIDTGAEFSLFNGFLATSIGLNLLDGEPKRLMSTAGDGVEARLHPVQISHDILGPFELKIAFSLSEIHRNLLGRDFLNLIQIGFLERQRQIYITPLP